MVTYFVSVGFVQGQQEAIASLMPAEQAHVRGLMEKGVVEAGYRSVDRSRSWMVLQGESPDHILQVLTSLPLYPFMELELTPLLDVRPGG